MGVSVENDKVMDRIDYLRKTHARTKFLSCEPLIGPLSSLNLNKIDWVIVGGESGRTPRPIEPEWVLDILINVKTRELNFSLNNGAAPVRRNRAESLMVNIIMECQSLIILNNHMKFFSRHKIKPIGLI
jgi:protein gp37